MKATVCSFFNGRTWRSFLRRTALPSPTLRAILWWAYESKLPSPCPSVVRKTTSTTRSAQRLRIFSSRIPSLTDFTIWLLCHPAGSGIWSSRTALQPSTLSLTAPQSLMTKPSNPQSPLKTISSKNSFCEACRPFILLYEHMIVHGFASQTAPSNDARYISRSALSSISDDIVNRRSSWLFAQKCLTHAPTFLLWIPLTNQPAHVVETNGSSENIRNYDHIMANV